MIRSERPKDQHCSGRFCPILDTLLKPEKKIADHADPSVFYNEDRAASYPFYSAKLVSMIMYLGQVTHSPIPQTGILSSLSLMICIFDPRNQIRLLFPASRISPTFSY